MTKFSDIEIDLSRDGLFDELGLKRLRESYMKDEESSPQERFAFVSKSLKNFEIYFLNIYIFDFIYLIEYFQSTVANQEM